LPFVKFETLGFLHLKNKIALFILVLGLSSCNWFAEKPLIATKLSEHFKNDLYESFDTAAYKPVFLQLLAEHEKKMLNPKVIKAFYEHNEYLPILVTKFFEDGQLDSLSAKIAASKADGFNPSIFFQQEISSNLNKFKENKFENIDEVYQVVAQLELNSALALNKYINFMRYGAINPHNFLDRFYIRVERPDSLSMDSVLNTLSVKDILLSAQPKHRNYLLLKNYLAEMRKQGLDEEGDLAKLIKVNMERFRWRLPQVTDELVEVNIPDFSLTWFRDTDTLTTMKVCVGAKREADYLNKRKAYMVSGHIEDKPKNHETPQLFSVFSAIQVNPIWNIPVSIAQREIYMMAKKDPYYLSNNNIAVYYKGQRIADPDTINWETYSPQKLPFRFKQEAGEGNALGKFKFVFDNSASIYLHDTNNKYAFKFANRAISHGCIRVENPLRFAELMVRDKRQYDKLRMEVDLPPLDTTKQAMYIKKQAQKADSVNVFKLKPTWFSPRKNIGVYIAYYTAWIDGNGQLQKRNDVYGQDPIIWQALKRYL
jgi:murein L,D-transpeptidase YcbB/YkuD